ncbi:cupin domain-containing protein [Streptomyces sp. NPDC049577]|uniref:cupin domain-containing protein n=1 Tax=Streptomyces sp. NPDC049577 TaxID=3155153 RepID=UPI0034219B75
MRPPTCWRWTCSPAGRDRRPRAGPEEVFVVSGVFNDGERDYPAGSFIHAPPAPGTSPRRRRAARCSSSTPKGDGPEGRRPPPLRLPARRLGRQHPPRWSGSRRKEAAERDSEVTDRAGRTRRPAPPAGRCAGPVCASWERGGVVTARAL